MVMRNFNMDEYTNYLVHHGTMGMRWGFRRYQNADGSLTPAGRKRYGAGPPRKGSIKDRIEAKKEYKKKKKATDAYNAKMATVQGSVDEALNGMTSKRLAKETARYKAANDYMRARIDLRKTVDEAKIKPGPTRGEKIATAASTIANIADSAAKIKTAYDKIFGSPDSQSESNKYAAEIKKLQLIEKKKSLGIEAEELKDYKMHGEENVKGLFKRQNSSYKNQTSNLSQDVNRLNKKIKKMSDIPGGNDLGNTSSNNQNGGAHGIKGQKWETRESTNVEKAAQMVSVIFNDAQILNGDVYKLK